MGVDPVMLVMPLPMALVSRHRGLGGDLCLTVSCAHSCPCATARNPSEEQTREPNCLMKTLANVTIVLI